jgi:curved DNA-binding protein CbpA
VSRLSSTKSIKQAYRRIALTSHPDKVSHEQRDEATKRFQDIQVAYDVLHDPSKRRQYDTDEFRQDGIDTPPPEADHDGTRPWYSGTQMPPTPESARGGYWWQRPSSHHSSFSSFDDNGRYDRRPKVMTFLEATLRFHPEDRRHLWLCSDEDDPAVHGGGHIVKRLQVSLQEY